MQGKSVTNKFVYNSAIHNQPPDGGQLKLTRYESNGCIVIAHNVLDPLPIEFQQCDILYAEPSWRSGIARFNERAGIKVDFKEYVNSIREIIINSEVPVVLNWGVNETKQMPVPDMAYMSKLWNISDCTLSIYNTHSEWPKFQSTESLFWWLSQKFECIGDFNCGYGNSGKRFLEQGKKFVMSDYDQQCVGYIAKTLMNYEGI